MAKKPFVAFLFFIACLTFPFPTKVLAAKKRPPRGGGETMVQRTYSRGVKASVRFRPDRRGLLVNFSGFGNIVSVSYSLTYKTNGLLQAVQGTMSSETAGETRELLFGTCSAGVCTYHTNITDARLVIDSKLKSGLIIRKPYRIKV